MASSRHAENRAAVQWRARIDWKAPAVRHRSIARADACGQLRVRSHDRLQHRRGFWNVHRPGVHIDAECCVGAHWVMKIRASAGGFTGDGSIFMYPTSASRSTMLSGVTFASAGGAQLSPPVAMKSLTITSYIAPSLSVRPAGR